MKSLEKNGMLIFKKSALLALLVPVMTSFVVLAPRGHECRAQGKEELRARMKVSAGKGLNLRETGSETSPVITTIPDGENVYVDRVTARQSKAAGRTGYWVAVTWNNYSGYVFSAFLKNDFPPSFRFKGLYYYIMAFPFAEKQKAELLLRKDEHQLSFSRGSVSFSELLPPATNVKTIISGFKQAPVLQEGHGVRVVFTIDSVKVILKGDFEYFTVRGRLASVDEIKTQ